jgi:hypothetical protein
MAWNSGAKKYLWISFGIWAHFLRRKTPQKTGLSGVPLRSILCAPRKERFQRPSNPGRMGEQRFCFSEIATSPLARPRG